MIWIEKEYMFDGKEIRFLSTMAYDCEFGVERMLQDGNGSWQEMRDRILHNIANHRAWNVKYLIENQERFLTENGFDFKSWKVIKHEDHFEQIGGDGEIEISEDCKSCQFLEISGLKTLRPAKNIATAIASSWESGKRGEKIRVVFIMNLNDAVNSKELWPQNP